MNDAMMRGPQRSTLNRLRRASGQLTAVIAAIEAGAPCRETVIQLAAVSKAVDRAACHMLATAMRMCVAPREDNHEATDDDMTEAEIEKLFLMLT
ncbi:MAG: metal-sensitive transcriptional regulator [Bifidobacteriaceae bacterium]|nr:metal-sensitive transcriptional regulator [Bifidobacteriaceae bacterium]